MESWGKERSYVTPQLRQYVLKRDGYKCVACWKGIAYNLRIDHIVGSLSRPENLQTLCHSCNLSKGSREFASIEDFRRWRYAHGYPIYEILARNGFKQADSLT